MTAPEQRKPEQSMDQWGRPITVHQLVGTEFERQLRMVVERMRGTNGSR